MEYQQKGKSSKTEFPYPHTVTPVSSERLKGRIKSRHEPLQKNVRWLELTVYLRNKI